MKIHIKNLFLAVFCLVTITQLSAMKRFTNPRTGRAYVGKYVRPNSKSSLRYFAVSPERNCVKTIKTTPLFRTTPRRRLSTTQRTLWPTTREELTPANKQEQLFNDLSNNIYLHNADKSLGSIAALFFEENIINEPGKNGLTPLQFAIQASSDKDNELQQQIVNIFIENGAQLQGTKEFELALKQPYNIGALAALIPHYKSSTIAQLDDFIKNEIRFLQHQSDIFRTTLKKLDPKSAIAIRMNKSKKRTEKNIDKLESINTTLSKYLNEPQFRYFEKKEEAEIQ